MKQRRYLKYERVRWENNEHLWTGIVLQQKQDTRIIVLILTCDGKDQGLPRELELSPYEQRNFFLRNL